MMKMTIIKCLCKKKHWKKKEFEAKFNDDEFDEEDDDRRYIVVNGDENNDVKRIRLNDDEKRIIRLGDENNDVKRFRVNDDENNDDIDFAEEFIKRVGASANCVPCGWLGIQCCSPDKCKKRHFRNKCIKYLN